MQNSKNPPWVFVCQNPPKKTKTRAIGFLLITTLDAIIGIRSSHFIPCVDKASQTFRLRPNPTTPFQTRELRYVDGTSLRAYTISVSAITIYCIARLSLSPAGPSMIDSLKIGISFVVMTFCRRKHINAVDG